MDVIFDEWEKRVNTIKEFDRPNTIGCGNVNLCVERFRDLAEFLRIHLPQLREWMMNYLKEHRKEIFLDFWMDHIHKWMRGHLDRFQREYLYPHAQEEWDSVFGEIYPFALALQRAKDLQSIYPIEKCDDIIIRSIHEGKPHNGGGFVCDRCEEQEYDWISELARRMTNSRHPLLSGSMPYYKKDDYLNHVDDSWEPPHVWGWLNHTTPCHDLEHYKNLLSSRIDPVSTAGKTPIQRLRPLYYSIISRNGWFLPYSKKPYERFISLWNKLDLIMFVIQIDLPQLIDLEVDYVECGKSKPYFITTH